MKIQAKLKDVVILPDEGNEYEKREILRVCGRLMKDPEAKIIIRGSIMNTINLAEPYPLQFYLEAITTIGHTDEVW